MVLNWVSKNIVTFSKNNKNIEEYQNLLTLGTPTEITYKKGFIHNDKGYSSSVLIYEFEKDENKVEGKLIEISSLTGKEHLEKSNIMRVLTNHNWY